MRWDPIFQMSRMPKMVANIMYFFLKCSTEMALRNGTVFVQILKFQPLLDRFPKRPFFY